MLSQLSYIPILKHTLRGLLSNLQHLPSPYQMCFKMVAVVSPTASPFCRSFSQTTPNAIQTTKPYWSTLTRRSPAPEYQAYLNALQYGGWPGNRTPYAWGAWFTVRCSHQCCSPPMLVHRTRIELVFLAWKASVLTDRRTVHVITTEK